MGFIADYEFIVKNSKGIIYNFYLNEKQQIEYILSDEKNQWIKKNIVFPQAIKSYAIDIDELDSIHILSISYEGIIHYHNLLKDNWVHKTLIDYGIEDIQIYYPIIKVVDNHIHAFYYLHRGYKNNICNLVHLFYNKGDGWKNKNQLKITYKNFINPLHVFFKETKIFILFTSLVKENTQIFIITYDYQLNEFKKPIQITDSSIDKLYLHGLFLFNTMHITWSEFDEKGLTVKYTKYCLNIIEDDINVISLSEKSNCSFPILIYYNNLLWCTWTQMNKLYSSYSKNEGRVWSNPLLRKESQQVNFKLYKYKTNYKKEQENIYFDYLYGTLYPKIQFLGFGGEII